MTKQQAPLILTAAHFIERLQELQCDAELKKIQRYFKSNAGDYGEGDQFIGVKMGQVFELAKEFMWMELDEIEKLLESDFHEARTGAVSIMDFQARSKKTSESRRKELFDLYINRHDRINNWDLVDRSAIYVIGSYLFDKPRTVLYELAQSKNIWERRTAIVSTAFFLKHRQTDDTFQIAAILVNDPEDLIQKAVGGWLRHTSGQAPEKLRAFLDKQAPTMPRTMLRYAIEHFGKEERDYYLGLKKTL